MTLGILKESDGEHRVALTPDALPGLMKLGFQNILVERGERALSRFSTMPVMKNKAHE